MDLFKSLNRVAGFIRTANLSDLERLEKSLRMNDSDKSGWESYYRLCKRTSTPPDFLFEFLQDQGKKKPPTFKEEIWTLSNFKLKHLNWIDRNLSLPKLKYLNLSFNLLKSITGITELNAPNLELLAIDDNPLKSLDGLENFQHDNLTTLSFTGCDISSIEALGSCRLPSLTVLHLSFNNIYDLSPLADLEANKLATLSLLGTSLDTAEDLEPIVGKFTLDWLSLPQNLREFDETIEEMFPGTTLYFDE